MRCVQICDKVQKLHIWDVQNTGSRTTVDVAGNVSIEDSDFEKLLKDMNESLGTTRGVQKAFLARSVIKWGLDFKKRTSRLNAYYEAMQKTTADISKRVVGKMASDMSMDEFRNLNTDDKLTEIYRQLQEISRRL